ncbi:hypothetical protein BKP35_16565 [Anaerobacillus arseniciselenatis]|uniref:Uncharacterized protein n=1 Tax=Anaerobacillus arseniciselenatis TaxID=85682 RepID=A0A1S2LCL5_9BACI|nr:hypothetical protein [Anaerobacillus arseniciselenatis]OIJ09467.1 hypothetical protein BKP35_16565 [Anaerobacillus arseniciselenatis]
MERKEVILATGDEHLDEFIREDLEKTERAKVVAKVTTRRTLINKINELSPHLVVVGDDLVGESEEQDASDQEWELVIEEIRRFSYNLRIVFICDRSIDEIFLTKLTTYNITDIFHDGKLPENYLTQILDLPSYKNIEKFRGQVESVSQKLREKKRAAEEEEAETLMRTGAIPKEGKVVEVEVPIFQQLIVKPQIFVFGSAVKGSGSSTLTKMFAEYLSNLQLQVGVLESPYACSSWFELINGKSYIKDDWQSWHELIQEEKEIRKGMSINVDSVTYLVQNPSVPLTKWNLMKSAYLVGYARQIPILLYDLSDGLIEENEKLILRQANHIFLSTQFDPARVNASQDSIVRFLHDQNLTHKITLLCNHSNEYLIKKFGENLSEAYNNIKKIYYFPHLEEVKNALMEGKSVWKMLSEEKANTLDEIFSSMAKQSLGKELFENLQPMKKKKSVLSLFKKKKRK